MLLATSLNVFWDKEGSLAPEAMLERCARVGFQGIDFNFCDYDRPRFERLVGARDAGAYARSLRAMAERLGLRFVQAHGPIYDKFAARENAEPLHAWSRESIRWVAELGVPWIVFEPETFAGAWDSAHLRELLQRNVAYFRDLLRVAEQAAVGLAIENHADVFARSCHRRRYGSTPAELIALVDALASPLVGVCWDVGHAQLQRLDQGRALRAIGTRLKALHIQDNDGATDQHLTPYLGQVDWPDVMRALRDIGYDGAFCYEAHNAIRVLPDALRDDMLRFTVSLARHLMQMA